MFKFSTKLDKHKINKYSNFRLNNILPQMIIIATIIILLGIIFIYQGSMILAVIWLLFGFLYVPTVLIITKVSQRIFSNKPESDLIDTDEIYIFNEDEIIIQQTDITNECDKSEFLYSDVYAFFKTKTDYVLFFSKDHTHIIPRKSIIEGSTENFDDYMKNRLGDLFKSRDFSI